MAHRLAPQVEFELDDIWYYIARDSGSAEIADRLIDSITDRFHLLEFEHTATLSTLQQTREQIAPWADDKSGTLLAFQASAWPSQIFAPLPQTVHRLLVPGTRNLRFVFQIVLPTYLRFNRT